MKKHIIRDQFNNMYENESEEQSSSSDEERDYFYIKYQENYYFKIEYDDEKDFVYKCEKKFKYFEYNEELHRLEFSNKSGKKYKFGELKNGFPYTIKIVSKR